jgi:pilus assembly protein CpaB
MKLAVVLLVVLGVLAAGAAALVVGAVKSGPELRSPEAQTVGALVAQRDLAAMTILTEDAIRTEMIPRSALAKGYLINPVQAIGKSLRVEVMKGQVVTESCLAAPGSAADCLPRIPAGMRVVTIPVSSRSVSGGFLCPGCIVDVITTAEQPGSSSRTKTVSRTLLQRTKVWGVDDDTIVSIQTQGENSSPKSNPGGSGSLRVSLLVDTRQAEVLQAATSRGSITLAIRNPLDETIDEPNDASIDRSEPLGLEAVDEAPADKANGQQAVEPPPEPLKTVEIIRGTKVTPKTFSPKPLEPEEGGKPYEPDNDWLADTPRADGS